jgi:hypothetical protein
VTVYVPALRLLALRNAVASQSLEPPDDTVPIDLPSGPKTVTVPWPQIKIPDVFVTTLIPKVGKLLLTLGTLANRIEVAIFVGVGIGVDAGVG